MHDDKMRIQFMRCKMDNTLRTTIQYYHYNYVMRMRTNFAMQMHTNFATRMHTMQWAHIRVDAILCNEMPCKAITCNDTQCFTTLYKSFQSSIVKGQISTAFTFAPLLLGQISSGTDNEQ